MTIISKVRAPEARYLYENIKMFIIFLKNHLLHQDTFLAHLLCYVTYVTSFNTCSYPGVNLVDI